MRERSLTNLTFVVKWCNVSMRDILRGVLLLMSCHCICLFDMEERTAECRDYAVETYFKDSKSTVATQRKFSRYFNLERHGKCQMLGQFL